MITSTNTSILAGDLTSAHDTQKMAPGTLAKDGDGNTYIYLKGVASTADGDFVVYDETYQTARLTANAVGEVAVAQAAVGASQYGWYMRTGFDSAANIASGTTDNKQLYATSTAGRASATKVVGDMILGAVGRGGNATSNSGGVQLSNPRVTDVIPAA